ncbi:MAG: HlyD family efflux transporter periplasmic adaptor subunit [Candidatus Paceibacterota bacterium]|jgi:HlyD family secretion protein
MKNIWSKIKTNFRWSRLKNFAFDHKVISLIIILVVIFVGYKIYGYFTNTSGETRYVISAVQKGTIISAVSGTGQVSASNQVTLNPKVSGTIVYVGAKSGQTVNQGQLLAQIDARDALLNLENAQVALDKLTEPADKLSVLQAQNALRDAEDAKTKAYIDGFNNVDNAFLDLPEIMTGLDTLFNSLTSSPYFSDGALLSNPTERNYRQIALNNYYRARDAYNKNLIDQRNISRNSTSSLIESLIKETYQTTKLTAQALKDTNTAVSFVIDQTDTKDRTVAMTTDLTNLSSWTNKITADASSLNAIDATLNSADRTIADKKETLTKLQEGTDPLDVRAQELAVEQKRNAYNDYFIRAPFDGMVQINVNVNDSASGGTSIGTIVSAKKIATISLNEVDIAKVKVGQKATLTFDAIDGLSIAGEVAEVDIVGTVSQGVVSYNVKISFDTQDERIRSGMSVSADIAIDVRQNVLVVPSSAVKSSGAIYYVETFGQDQAVTNSQGITSTKTPQQITVTTGQSDDTNTEVLRGLKEGDKIITQTLAAGATAKKAASITSLFSPSRQKTTTSSKSSSSSKTNTTGGMGGPPAF